VSRPHLTVLGMPGSGKTTVGSIVAERAGLPLRDGDPALFDRTGRTAQEIDATDGVEALHATEREVTRALLEDPEPAVVTPAASALDDPGTVDAIRAQSWLIVLLDIEPSVAAARAGTGDHRRPMDADEMATRWSTRRPVAASIADVILDASQAPIELAERIAEIRAC